MIPTNTDELFNSLPDTVLLVGNGPCKNMGSKIDNYDYVIRFNDFVIDGYEIDIGTKTDAISLHTWDLTRQLPENLMKNYYNFINKLPIFTLQLNHKKNIYNILCPPHNTKPLSQDPPITGNGFRLSSAIALAINLVLFYDKQIHLAGFDFMKTGHYYNSKHEHSAEHQILDQYKIISKLSNIIIL